jgi:hypothetical protein
VVWAVGRCCLSFAAPLLVAVWLPMSARCVPVQVCGLDTFCTALHCYPSASRKQQPGAGTDVFLLACIDGELPGIKQAQGKRAPHV